MARAAYKKLNNKYRAARLTAAEYNDELRSMERASQLLSVSRDSLSNYELGVCKVVPNDVIVRMADLYNAPELLNDYCATECPIGISTQHKLLLRPVGDIAIRLANRSETLNITKTDLLRIMDDGIIDAVEKRQVPEIFEALDDLERVIEEFKLFCRKEGYV